MKPDKRLSLVVTLVFALALLLALLPIAGCATSNPQDLSSSPGVTTLQHEAPYAPDFDSPTTKLEELEHQSFTRLIYDEAVAYEPLLVKPGTQAGLGFWSGPNNHGSLVRVLDSMNATSATNGQPARRAIWDEGATSSNQYPAYVEMLQEQWYARDNAKNGKVNIYGVQYTDPYPVTPAQADDIWGEYSQRYADTAALIKTATGKPVQAWCFVQGARANRVFYKYELPELKKLEQSGDVQVFFAKSQDADWQNPADWIEGTANAPQPAQ